MANLVSEPRYGELNDLVNAYPVSPSAMIGLK